MINNYRDNNSMTIDHYCYYKNYYYHHHHYIYIYIYHHCYRRIYTSLAILAWTAMPGLEGWECAILPGMNVWPLWLMVAGQRWLLFLTEQVQKVVSLETRLTLNECPLLSTSRSFPFCDPPTITSYTTGPSRGMSSGSDSSRSDLQHRNKKTWLKCE